MKTATLRLGLLLTALLVGCGTSAETASENEAEGGIGGAAAGAGGAGAGSAGAAPATGGGGGGDVATGGSAGAGGTGIVAPPSAWVNATGTLAGLDSECGNLTLVAAKPGSDMVIAGVARKGLYATTDGKTWRELGAGAGSDTIINRPSSIVFDPEHPEVFWESGIYNGGGVYVTKDNGETFSQLGNITHNDLVSIDFTDPERKTLLAGGHEQKRTLHHSTDAGQTWTNIGDRLPEDSHFSTAPLIIDTNVYLVGACGWGDGACGVFRSTDGGASFVKASALGATNAPLLASDGFIYYPLIWDNGIALSKNQGETWLKPVGYGVVKTVRPVELPDGRILSVGERSLMLATAGGGAFRAVGEPLPFASPAGLAYSAATKTVYIWRNDCGNKVLPNAIMSAGFDYSVE